MNQRLLSPSKITAWLDCPHYLTLRSRVDDGLRPEPESVFGSFARMLLDKGRAHEAACLAYYEQQGDVVHVPPQQGGEQFAAWVARVGNLFAAEPDVVYQMPFVQDGIRGVADFVVRAVDTDTAAVCYEPVDAKLARAAAKPGHVLQLCFYAEAIEALTGIRPQHMHLWLGSGRLETLRVDEFRPLWRRLRRRLTQSLAAGPAANTVAQRNPHCEFCEFHEVCDQEWRNADSLIYVAGIRKLDIDTLVAADIATLTALAGANGEVSGFADERLTRLRGQAALQLHARDEPATKPPFHRIEPGQEPWGHGLEQLPEPHAGDVFIDFEGHPFWRADTGLFFLFGVLEQGSDGEWRYRASWAHDLDGQAAAVIELIGYLNKRRQDFPGMHVYHYNHTERSALQQMVQAQGDGERNLAELIDTGAFVDLLPVARHSFQVGVESYGLKHLERLTDFERHHQIDKGASAVVRYEHYLTMGDQADLDAIAAYNEDDVRATMALRDWLVAHRPPGMTWRDAYLEPDEGLPELNAAIEALHRFEVGTHEHNLGDLLAYWRTEWFAYLAPKKAKLEADPAESLDDPEVIADLVFAGEYDRFGNTGKLLDPGRRFTFEHQMLDRFPTTGGTVMIAAPDGQRFVASIERLDRQGSQLDLTWGKKLQEADFLPRSAVLYDWVGTKTKSDALQAFAEDVLAGRDANPVTLALLRRDLPRFTGAGPRDEVFSDDLDDMTSWVTRLDRSFVAVQGPPGTGKTYRAARLVRALVRAGQRVGITAFSHHAIANVLNAVLAAFTESDELGLLRAVCNPGESPVRLAGISYHGNDGCAGGDFNVVAGTTWLFSSPAMRAAPVDVLLIDEAGQFALADALAASGAAHNLVLLGDPLQLPQVAHANHAGIAGRSVLEHIVEDAPTLPDDRGVFLRRTRRMHPDVCTFISEQIYAGRLDGEPDCARQSTIAGTGLRWLRADHHGNRTSSVQEADLIADQLSQLIGTEWINCDGEQNRLDADDFMVVAPYNDQVRLIRERLSQDSALAAVPVGTVDKFQGREAAVVLFSMATSSGADMIRGMDFLFSRNRLNVAISRARCLAYLVCTDELLDARARTVEEMRLISTLNAFVEVAVKRSQQALPEDFPKS